MGNVLFVLLSVVSSASSSYSEGGAGPVEPGGGRVRFGSNNDNSIIREYPADDATFNLPDESFSFVFLCPLVTMMPGYSDDLALTVPMSYFVVPQSFEGRNGLVLEFDPQPVQAQRYTRLDGSSACRAIVPAPVVEGLDPAEVVAQFSPGTFSSILVDSDGSEVATYSSLITIRAELGVVIGNSADGRASRTLVVGDTQSAQNLGFSANGGGCGVVSSTAGGSTALILFLVLMMGSLLALRRLTKVQPTPTMKP